MKFILLVGSLMIISSVALRHESSKDQDIDKFIEQLKNDQQFARLVLLDSNVVQIQADLLIRDSLMSVYLINQLEFRPELARRLIFNLERHFYLDESSTSYALKRIEQDEFINCCL